jgi:hypothetical protein
MRGVFRSAAILLATALPATGLALNETYSACAGQIQQVFDNDRSHTLTDPEFPDDSRNPSLDEQQRLRVKWGDSPVGYFDYDSTQDRLVPVPTDRLRPPGMLGVRGKLMIESIDGKSADPVTWLQGIRVVIARTPEERPDWSKQHNKGDSVWHDCVLEGDGSFLVTFAPNTIRRPVGRTGTFQIAVCLGTKAGKTITWKNDVPILPKTLGTIQIKGPNRLSPTMEAINGAPSVTWKNCKSIGLVRAVNHLQSLGKSKAISEMREFLRIARDSRGVDRDPANIDTSDYQCIFLIVRLLFEPENASEPLPPMRIGGMYPSPQKADESLWPLFPLALQDDVPFVLIECAVLSGLPEPPSLHVDWAEKHGRLRAKPLRPADDPILAVDKLIALRQTQRLLDWHSPLVLRRQAWRAIASLARRPPPLGDLVSRTKEENDAEWEQCKRIAAQLRLRWDTKQQNYVAE